MEKITPAPKSTNGHRFLEAVLTMTPPTFYLWCATCDKPVKPDELDEHGLGWYGGKLTQREPGYVWIHDAPSRRRRRGHRS